MPEEIQDIQVQENPIYKFMKSNNLTKLDEKTFLDTYSKPEKAKEIHSFMISNDLTKLDESKFYDSYLKKKDQTLPSGEISSLTELPSKFIEPLKKGVSPTPAKTKEEEIVLDKLGVKPYTGVTIPTNLPKQDVVKYEKQLKVQDAAINTLIDVYKQKGLKFDPSKPAAQKQIQDYIEKEQNNDLGLVEGIRDKKPYLTRTSGLGETLYSTAIESFKEPIKSTKINTITNPKEFADFADEEIKNTPNVPESVPSNVGGYLGQLGGGLPKLAAEEAVGGPALVAAEMYWNGIANQRKALYQKGLDQGMDRIQAAQMAMDNATTSAIPDFLVGAILAVGVKGHTGILKQGTADAFKDAMKNVVKSSPKMFAVGAGAEFGRAEAQKQAGYKVDRTEEVENMFRGGGDLAKMDAAFKTAMAAPYVPKILYAAAKNVLSETPKPVLDALAQKYGDNGKVVDDVSKFAQTKVEVQDLVPEGKVASVTGLTQKVKNIQQDIDDLTARREKTTDALKPQIDSWIKEYQDEINFYNKQINKVVESKDPTGVTEEVDDITGQKIGTKQYVVDGKEVSQEEFEAMQGKPIGTKEIITEEVKPTEVKEKAKPEEAISAKELKNITTENIEDKLRNIEFEVTNEEGKKDIHHGSDIYKTGSKIIINDIEYPTYAIEGRNESNYFEFIINNKGEIEPRYKNIVKVNQLPKSEIDVKDTAKKLKDIADSREKNNKRDDKTFQLYNDVEKLVGKGRNGFDYTKNKWEDVSKFYHKALKDGSNPELIKMVDDYLEGTEIEIEKPELTKDDLKKAEAKFAAAEDKFKKARNKIETTQVKRAGMFGGEQKGMFAMGGEEAKKTLDPLRKAAKEARAELDDIRNKIKVQEEAQPELKPIESKDEEFIDKKIKLIKQQGKPLSEFKVGDKVFFASDWSKNWKQYSEGTIVKAGADYQIKRFSEHPESKRFKIFNLRSNDKVMLKPEGEANYTGQESISKAKEEVTPYQKALKEKQEIERRLTRQIAGEKAGITRNVIKEASKIEPSDARSAALKYLAGGNLSWEAIDEVAGNVKRARLNTGERELKSEEARSRDYVAKKGQGDDLDDAVHFIWSELHGISEELSGIEDTEIKNALMQAISEYPSKVEAAQALINGYKEVDLEAEEAAFYERYDITPEAEEAEAAKLEATLEKPGEDDYNFGKVPDEHINNLIEQYETEIERQAKQPSKGGKEKITEKVSAREAGKPQEVKSVEEAYKDLTKIEKRQIINSKFEELLKELKIEKICPTD